MSYPSFPYHAMNDHYNNTYAGLSNGTASQWIPTYDTSTNWNTNSQWMPNQVSTSYYNQTDETRNQVNNAGSANVNICPSIYPGNNIQNIDTNNAVPSNTSLHGTYSNPTYEPNETISNRFKISRNPSPGIYIFDPQILTTQDLDIYSTGTNYRTSKDSPLQNARHNSRSPLRNARHNSRSPLRNARHNSRSPLRNARHNSRSPLRNARHNSRSPLRTARHNSRSPLQNLDVSERKRHSSSRRSLLRLDRRSISRGRRSHSRNRKSIPKNIKAKFGGRLSFSRSRKSFSRDSLSTAIGRYSTKELPVTELAPVKTESSTRHRNLKNGRVTLAEHHSHGVPSTVKSNEDDARAFLRRMHDKRCDDLRKNPHKHPSFAKEKKNWDKYMESKGFDIKCSTVKEEWTKFWTKVLEELLLEEWAEKKKSLFKPITVTVPLRAETKHPSKLSRKRSLSPPLEGRRKSSISTTERRKRSCSPTSQKRKSPRHHGSIQNSQKISNRKDRNWNKTKEARKNLRHQPTKKKEDEEIRRDKKRPEEKVKEIVSKKSSIELPKKVPTDLPKNKSSSCQRSERDPVKRHESLSLHKSMSDKNPTDLPMIDEINQMISNKLNKISSNKDNAQNFQSRSEKPKTSNLDFIDSVNASTMKTNFFEVIDLLNDLCDRMDELASPIKKFHDINLLNKNNGSWTEDFLYNDECVAFLMTMKRKLGALLASPSVTIVQLAIYQEAKSKLESLIDAINVARQSKPTINYLHGLNITNLAKATLELDCPGTVKFIKDAVAYERSEPLADHKMMEVFLAVRKEQSSQSIDTDM